jgi:hypothetical protein
MAVKTTKSSEMTATTQLPEDEIIWRIQACRSYQEWLEFTKSLPPEDGGYDIVKSLDLRRIGWGQFPYLAFGEIFRLTTILIHGGLERF